MARPKKKNADYFSHDADMRNDPKIKALRRKFGLKGYAIWTMFLEVLTDADFFEYEWNTLNIELLAGDFDVEPKVLEEIINYCTLTLKLFEMEDNIIYSPEMKNRFETVLNRRSEDRKRKEKEFSNGKTPEPEVILAESTQSKVKESKVKDIKLNKSLLSEISISDVPNEFQEYFKIAVSFQKLFIKNLQEREAPTKNQRQATFKNYVTPIRLMIENDNTTREQIRQAYDFLKSKEGEFWKSNILSTKKLREQIDKLIAQKNAPKRDGTVTPVDEKVRSKIAQYD